MTFKELRDIMKRLYVGCRVKYKDNFSSKETKDGIITDIKHCSSINECKKSTECVGYIGINGKKPDCIIYSSNSNKCLIHSIINDPQYFIEKDEFMI